jgi:hypothetical protein
MWWLYSWKRQKMEDDFEDLRSKAAADWKN